MNTDDIRSRSILGVLVIMPVVIWLVSAEISEVFNGLGATVQFFAKSAAFIGMASYFLMPILAMRHQLLERIFGSLDEVYALHRTVSKLSLILLFMHPVLLGMAAIIDSRIGEGVWAWGSITVWSGVITLWAMILVASVSLYAHVTHQRWILVHRLFGWLIIPSMFHALLAGKVVASNGVALAYFSLLAITGFAAFLYRSVFGRILVKKYPYVVSEVTEKEGDVTELVLKPSSSVSMPYEAGQFAYLTLLSPVVDEEAHPYTISTAPNGPYIRFAIKELGDYTSKIDEIKPGTKALIEGPYGDFTRGINTAKKQAWIAGGIGITPFLSVARSIIDRDNLDIHLLYAMNKIDDAVFLDELKDIKSETKQKFTYTLVPSDTVGFISEEIIAKEVPDVLDREFFICGPPPMMDATKQHLHKLGLPPNQMHTEEFSY